MTTEKTDTAFSEYERAMADVANTIRRLGERRRVGEVRARRRRAIESAAVLILLSSGTAYALMLIAGIWHDLHPSIPAPGFLIIWATLLVARAVVASITAKITPPRRSARASRKP